MCARLGAFATPGVLALFTAGAARNEIYTPAIDRSFRRIWRLLVRNNRAIDNCRSRTSCACNASLIAEQSTAASVAECEVSSRHDRLSVANKWAHGNEGGLSLSTPRFPPSSNLVKRQTLAWAALTRPHHGLISYPTRRGPTGILDWEGRERREGLTI